MRQRSDDRALVIVLLALIISVVMVALAPVVISGIMGKSVPDGLIAVSDKCITGLIGVLGTVAGIAWKSRGDGPTGTPGDPVSTTRANPMNGPIEP